MQRMPLLRNLFHVMDGCETCSITQSNDIKIIIIERKMYEPEKCWIWAEKEHELKQPVQVFKKSRNLEKAGHKLFKKWIIKLVLTLYFWIFYLT